MRYFSVLFLLLINCDSQQPQQTYYSIKNDQDITTHLTDLSNWGKWGKDDQLGTLNFITEKEIQKAASLVKEGISVSLSREVSIKLTPGIRNGSYEMMKDSFASRDFSGAIWHGFAQTHLDALCHIFASPDSMYNGISTHEITENGCGSLGIEKIAERGVVGRGILLDISSVRKATTVPGEAILIRDIEEAVKKQGIKINPGDILFIRTGAGRNNTREQRSGLHPECLFWIKDKQIALLGSDGDNDVHPIKDFDRYSSAFHSVGIPYMGLPLIDNAELDALALTCERLNRWEFMVTIAPWRLRGATSSPINPIAIF